MKNIGAGACGPAGKMIRAGCVVTTVVDTATGARMSINRFVARVPDAQPEDQIWFVDGHNRL